MLPTAVLASLTLAASLVLPASAAETAGSASHAAAVSVTGMVTASGTADAGVKVTIHAWPDQSIVQSLKVGQVVPWVFVGTATTDASGHYAISLPVAKLMPESSDGVVNLEADTSSAGYSFPVVVTKNAGNAFLAADPVANITRTDTSHCNGVWQYYASLGKHEATVGETYVPGNQAKQQFTYLRHQSSAEGIGFSVSGDNGSFSEDGTYSWSVSYREKWGAFGPHHSVLYRTQFHYGEYRCNLGEGIYHGFMQHVNGYAGGATHETPHSVPHTPSRFCVPQDKTSAPQSNNTAAVTWTKSLGIHAGLGFHASVETGFDTSAQITYTYIHAGSLCGWKDNPGGSPKQLVVRSTSDR